MCRLAFYNNAAHTVICVGWHFITTLLTQLYVWVAILLTLGKQFHGRIISLRRDVCAHKTSLTPPFFIEVSVPAQDSER